MGEHQFNGSSDERKTKLRRYIYACKSRYTPARLRALSQPIIQQVLCHPRVRAARTLLLYHSLADEVYTHDVVAQLFQDGHTILLPKVTGPGTMDLIEYEGPASMTIGAYHIMEPVGRPFAFDKPIEVGIIPGMAFDALGNRLGRGKGYYDRLLTAHPEIYKIGLCFRFQQVDTVPCASTDIPMDEVLPHEKE